jgi:uncharacterized integral membrane protein
MDARREAPRRKGLSLRAVAGIIVALLVALFIAVNRDETEISFIVMDRTTALWIALTVAAAGGFLAGFLIGRHRYRT